MDRVEERARQRADRFARVVRFWNDGPVVSDDDVYRVIRLFAREEPLASRPVFEATELSEPVSRTEFVFFGPPDPNEESSGISINMVRSGAILPGAEVWRGRDGGYVMARSCATTTLDIPDASWLDARGQNVPPTDSAATYVDALERNRQDVGTVLTDLAARRWTVPEQYARDLFRRCVVPFAVYDPTAFTGARLWLNGVEACIAQGVSDFLRDATLHGRLRGCAHAGCERLLFGRPAVGRPARFCSASHRDAAKYAARRAG